MRVAVVKEITPRLWGDDYVMGYSVDAPQIRQVPALQAAGVACMIPSGILVPLLSQAPILRGAERMQLTGVDCGMLESLPPLC